MRKLDQMWTRVKSRGIQKKECKLAPRVIDWVPHLVRLEDSDDIEHYLLTFKRLAEVYQWPKEDWAIHLIPLHTGKARSAFVAMDPSHTQDYDFVKTAILKSMRSMQRLIE